MNNSVTMRSDPDPEKFKHLIQPFFHEGGSEAVLLLHGYTGSPSEVKPLGEFLAKEGFTVAIPLLPGHGTTHLELEKCTWKDWYGAVEGEWKRLSEKYDRVYVAGLSMGGILALNLAANYRLDAVITLASGVRLSDWRIPILPVIEFFFRRLKKTNNAYARGPERIRFAYEYNSTSSIKQLLKSYRYVEENLQKIESPLLMINSRDDITVPFTKNTEIIIPKVSSNIKRLVALENAGHIITLSEEKEKIFSEVLEFIQSLKE